MYEINNSYHNIEVRLVYEYWLSKANGRPMPRRADIDPIEMRGWLAAVLLAEAVFDADGAPIDFYFRVSGSRVCERYGRELTRRRLSDVSLDHQNANVLATYQAAIETGGPIYSINRFEDDDNILRSFEMLLMPLSTDGRACDMVLGVVMPLPRDYDAPEGVWIYEAGAAPEPDPL